MSAVDSLERCLAGDPVSLINHHLQGPGEAVSTEYMADMVYEIASTVALTEEQKIERITAALNEYRCKVLRYLAMGTGS